MRYIAPDTPSGRASLSEAEFVRRTVRSLHRYFERRIQGQAEKEGFTLPQVRVLRQIVAHPGVTVTQLAQGLEISQSTTSGIVARLAAKGVLERRPDASDRRSTGLWPTDAVNTFMAGDRMQFVNGPAAELLDSLDMADRQTVLTAMRALSEQLERNKAAGDARG